MKKLYILLALLMTIVVSCSKENEQPVDDNPSDTRFDFKYDSPAAGEATIVSYNVKSKPNKYIDLVLPDSVVFEGKTYTITEIGANAFRSKENPQSVTLNKSLRKIGENAFMGCGLQRIEWNDQLEEIGPGAFYYTCIRELILPEGLKKIGAEAFAENQYYFDIVSLPASVEEIGNAAFGQSSIHKCTVNPANRNFKVSDGLLMSYDGKRVLICIKVLDENLAVPEGVQTIDDYAFYYIGIVSLKLPDSLETMGKAAFMRCIYLETVDFGAGLKVILEAAFQDCNSLSQIGPFREGLTRIEANAFKSCMGMETLELPKSLQYVGRYAFSEWSELKSITFNSYPLTIDENAFACIICRLNEVRFLGNGVPDITPTSFPNTNSYVIYVPATLLDACRNAWPFLMADIKPLE